MYECSLREILEINNMLLQFLEEEKIDYKELDLMRIRLHEPSKNGQLKFEIGYPRSDKELVQ